MALMRTPMKTLRAVNFFLSFCVDQFLTSDDYDEGGLGRLVGQTDVYKMMMISFIENYDAVYYDDDDDHHHHDVDDHASVVKWMRRWWKNAEYAEINSNSIPFFAINKILIIMNHMMMVMMMMIMMMVMMVVVKTNIHPQ